jgi:hypothetical protein
LAVDRFGQARPARVAFLGEDQDGVDPYPVVRSSASGPGLQGFFDLMTKGAYCFRQLVALRSLSAQDDDSANRKLILRDCGVG